jgi:hypothetical protein
MAKCKGPDGSHEIPKATRPEGIGAIFSKRSEAKLSLAVADPLGKVSVQKKNLYNRKDQVTEQIQNQIFRSRGETKLIRRKPEPIAKYKLPYASDKIQKENRPEGIGAKTARKLETIKVTLLPAKADPLSKVSAPKGPQRNRKSPRTEHFPNEKTRPEANRKKKIPEPEPMTKYMSVHGSHQILKATRPEGIGPTFVRNNQMPSWPRRRLT